MKIALATSNRGKIREFNRFFDDEIIAYSDLMTPFEIIEDGETFAQNALLKARAISKKLGSEYIVLADDSGISVPLLGGVPGIYSARFAGVDASDGDNMRFLIDKLKEQGVARTPAFYTAAIALVCNEGEFVTHGWMHGDVIDEARGEGGFGYDPMFIPLGFDKTLGELDETVKKEFSHRSKALRLMQPILEMLKDKQ
jgi:XTP/dITP diphosphohydrolase